MRKAAVDVHFDENDSVYRARRQRRRGNHLVRTVSRTRQGRASEEWQRGESWRRRIVGKVRRQLDSYGVTTLITPY